VEGEFVKLIVFGLLLLAGCGQFTTGDGAYTGRLVDVEWGGLFFKSCEVDVQIGITKELEHLSSSNEKLCRELQGLVGQDVSMKYVTWVGPCCLKLETPYEIVPPVVLGSGK
jgi:hypothetical protein